MTTPDLRALLPHGSTPAVLRLLGGDRPHVDLDGTRRELPEGSRRLVAYLGVHDGWADRRTAAGALWPYGNDKRAAGNLRSAVWRLRGAGIEVMESDKSTLRLRSGVLVDATLVADWAARLIEGRAGAADLDVRAWSPALPELLHGWSDEWVVFPRERLRQRALHGVEALSRHLVRAGRIAAGIEAAAAAVAVDPLRESAQRVLVEAQIAAGNLGAVYRIFHEYRALVSGALNVVPGRAFTRMVDAARGVG
jgi:DNA-binding SARP family transcriptional activator